MHYIVKVRVRRQLFDTVNVMVEADDEAEAERLAEAGLEDHIINSEDRVPLALQTLDFTDESDPDALYADEVVEVNPETIGEAIEVHLDCTKED